MVRRTATDALTLFDSLVYTCLYRVVIDPPSEAQAWVMQVRHQLRDRIGAFEGFYRLPGIVLIEADLPPEYERPLCDSVERAAGLHRPFPIRLDGIAHTPDRKCIHIGVDAGRSFLPLRDGLSDHARVNKRIKKLGVDAAEEPRLVIADGLKAAQFEQAWAMLEGESFNGQRQVNDVVVLKREWSDTSMDEHVRTCRLLGGL